MRQSIPLFGAIISKALSALLSSLRFALPSSAGPALPFSMRSALPTLKRTTKFFALLSTVILVVFSLLTCLFGAAPAFAQKADSAGAPTFKLTGDAKINSHTIIHGLSYTDKDPGIQGNFFFNFGPQFKLGFSGANVKFDDTNFWLGLKGLVKVDFGGGTNMNLYYFNDFYYKSTVRNGNTLGVNLEFPIFKLSYDMESNWEGTGQSAQYINVAKEFKIPWDLGVLTALGYTLQRSASYSDYFDLLLGLIYRTKQAGTWDLSSTYTSNSSQFSGRGDLFFKASVQFEF